MIEENNSKTKYLFCRVILSIIEPKNLATAIGKKRTKEHSKCLTTCLMKSIKKNINKQTLLEQTKNILYNQLLTANASVQH